MINEKQLRSMIKKACLEFGEKFYSKDVEDQMFGIVSQETLRGTFKIQLGFDIDSHKGGRGIGQMETITANFVKDYAKRKSGKIYKIYYKWRNESLKIGENLMSDDIFSLIMMRIYLWTKPESIPSTLEDQAKYWKDHWNTELGDGTVEEYIRNYNK